MKTVKKTNKKAFTMIELVFVIVIMAILSKFGVEFLAQAYKSFINTKINNELQSNSAYATELVASRMQYRIKASTIAREDNDTFTPLSSYYSTSANIIEWIGADIEGFRGGNTSYWSGVIDLASTDMSNISSPRTDTSKADTLIQRLSNGTTDIDDTAIYFVNPDSIDEHWGWDYNTTGTKANFITQLGTPSVNAIHPVKADTNTSIFRPVNSDGVDNNISGVTAYEFYQLAWSAYAVGIDDYNASEGVGTLKLWYNYQPWKGETRADGNNSVIMHDVSSFQFIARESLVKIQVCVKSTLLKKDERYSVCKEKTIF